LLSDCLVDEIAVRVIPVILGGGIPLFGSLENVTRLIRVHTTAFDFGFVQTTCSVKTMHGKALSIGRAKSARP
jgi:hypothetical protein